MTATASFNPKLNAHPKETKEKCKLLWYQGVRPHLICVETGVKPGTLKTWIKRGGWARAVAEGQAIMVNRGITALTRETTAQLEGASSALREQFANLLAKGAEKLANAPLVESISHVKEFGDALEPLVRSAKIVHGWGSEGQAGLILGDLLSSDQTPTEIAASVESVNPVTEVNQPAIEPTTSNTEPA